VLLVQCMNALYGSMIASILFYKKFVDSLKKHRFEMNPYEACVANTTKDGGVLAICFHVDGFKILHRSEAVIDSTINWLQSEYEVLFEGTVGTFILISSRSGGEEK
jgi:hypothetical protein